MMGLGQLRRRLLPCQTRGTRAEQLACDFLRSQGMAIQERNVRYPVGEIDIIAREGQTLCFVEVRSTSSMQWGGPLVSITDRKRRRMIAAARWYLHDGRIHAIESRFDVVAIEWRGHVAASVELIRGACTADA